MQNPISMIPGLATKARWLIARLVSVIAVLWGAATLTFFVVKLIPGDPVTILIGGGDNQVDTAFREQLIHRYDLDKPVFYQYLSYCRRALTGELGDSYQFQQPVFSVLGQALTQTLPLALSAITLAMALALISATLTAGRYWRLRALLSGLELIILSTPVYWTGILLLSVFSFSLHWFDVTGNNGLASLILPVITLCLPLAAVFSQVLRDGLEDALEQPFALTVRARGVSETALRWRHALRHGALALSTVAGSLLAGVLGGSILTETVFGRGGIGQITLNAIENRDMPLILGVVMFSALAFVVINLTLDFLYFIIDPRLRIQEAANERA